MKMLFAIKYPSTKTKLWASKGSGKFEELNIRIDNLVQDLDLTNGQLILMTLDEELSLDFVFEM